MLGCFHSSGLFALRIASIYMRMNQLSLTSRKCRSVGGEAGVYMLGLMPWTTRMMISGCSNAATLFTILSSREQWCRPLRSHTACMLPRTDTATASNWMAADADKSLLWRGMQGKERKAERHFKFIFSGRSGALGVLCMLRFFYFHWHYLYLLFRKDKPNGHAKRS